jgi:hypothetical protein
MSLGWKRFSFFDKEERPEHDVPENSTCSASGNDLLILGCGDGQVASPSLLPVHMHSKLLRNFARERERERERERDG